MPCPPISILLDQELVETSSVTQDGASRKDCHVSQSLFAIACSVSGDEGVVLHPLNVRVALASPSSGASVTGAPRPSSARSAARSSLARFSVASALRAAPRRTSCELVSFRSSPAAQDAALDDVEESPPAKRPKLDGEGPDRRGLPTRENGAAPRAGRAVDIMAEAGRLAELIASTLLDP
jgi:hypothetical protein